MAKCAKCRQKISDADSQLGKCSHCGAEFPSLLSTARPPFDPTSAGLEPEHPENRVEESSSLPKSAASMPAKAQAAPAAEGFVPSGTAVPDLPAGGAGIGFGTAVPSTVYPSSLDLPPSDVPSDSSAPSGTAAPDAGAQSTATAVPETVVPEVSAQPQSQTPGPLTPSPHATATLQPVDPTARGASPAFVPQATQLLEPPVATAGGAPEAFSPQVTEVLQPAVPSEAALSQAGAGQPTAILQPAVPSEAVPPPPASEKPASGQAGEESFDAGHSIKPHQGANFDQTEIEVSPDDLGATVAEPDENLNASGTIPILKPTEPLARGAAGKKEDGRKSDGPEASLVIQRRDVRHPDEIEREDAAARYDYDVTKKIGEGGMGVVYQANQGSLNREVALKKIKPRGLDDSHRARYTVQEAARVEQALQKRDRDWFLSEAVVTANLEHPYIVPIYDMVKDRKDSLFYAMKWVRGTPWSELIQEKSRTESEHLEILLKVADAVAFAHEKGVIHRDLKPENVMVGKHGEVYVMDWGAALVTPQFERSTNLSQSSSGFGSVLYAAPELFMGGVELITAKSDVYLLGAILFEIIAGYPPHPYPNSRTEALNNLRGNLIRPTDKKGELLDIALTAMATDPADRYASVQKLQTAIREYQKHTVSLQLSTGAQETLQRAEESGDYQDYARAVFGFDEALKSWPGNSQAQDGVGQAKLQYAQAALKQGNFELGLQTADAGDPKHADVITRLKAGQLERDSRQKRLKTMRRAIGAMAAIIVVGLGLGVFLVNEQREKAVVARDDADRERTKAITARDDANTQREIAVKLAASETAAKIDAQNQKTIADEQREVAVQKKKEADDQREIALAKKKEADEQREIAENKKKEADEQRMEADDQRMKAVAAAKEEEKAKIAAVAAKEAQEYEAYVAEIGLADSKIKTGAFEDVRSVLDEIRKQEAAKKRKAAADAEAAKDDADKQAEILAGARSLRGWEFGRLEYLAGQASVLFRAAGEDQAGDLRIEALALSGDGKWFVAGRKNGTFVIGATTSDSKTAQRSGVYGGPIHAVALSSNGKLIATAGDRGIQLWAADLNSQENPTKVGEPFAKQPVYSAQFGERSGKTWLLTGGADKTAQVWEVATDHLQPPKKIGEDLVGHHFGAIRRAVFSPDGSLIVTVGDDIRAVVWQWNAQKGAFESLPTVFDGHRSEILAAAVFSAAGNTQVATADVDGRILVWQPVPAKASSSKGKTALPAIELEQHDKAVHALAFSPDGRFILSGSDDNTLKLQRVVKLSEAARPASDDVQTFRGHGGWVRGCAIGSLEAGERASADRNPVSNGFFVSASHDGTVRRWNVSTYREERVFHDPILVGITKPDRDVLSAAFAPDGKTVLTGGRDHKGYQWDVLTGVRKDSNFKPTVKLIEEGHDLPIWTAAFAPRGNWLVTAGMDDRALLWNMETGTQFDKILHTGVPASVAVSPDGKWIATSHMPPKKDLVDKTSAIKLTAFAKSDEQPHKVRFWKVKPDALGIEEARRSQVQNVEHQQLSMLAFSPDGKYLYSGFNRGGGLVWKAPGEGDNSEWTVAMTIRTPVQICAAGFAGGNTGLLTAHENGEVWQHNLFDGQAPQSRLVVKRESRNPSSRPLHAMAVLPDGKSFLTLSEIESDPAPGQKKPAVDSYQIRHWDLATAAEIKDIKFSTPNSFTLAVSPQGDEALVVAAAPKDQKEGGTLVRRFDLKSGDEIKRNGESFLDTSEKRDPSGKVVRQADPRQYWNAIYAPVAADAPKRKQILALHGTRAELLDEDGTLAKRSSPHGQVRSVSYSPGKGEFFLTAGSDGTIKIWETETLKAKCQLVNPHGDKNPSIDSAKFSPVFAGSYQILSAARDRSVKLWDWDGKSSAPTLVRSFTHDSEVRSAAFSHDAEQIACGCNDGTVWVWNAKNDKQPLRKTRNNVDNDDKPQGHSRSVRHVAFANGNDDWIVTAGDDNLAYVWKNGKELMAHAVLKGHAAAVRSVAFSLENDRIVTGSDDTFAKVWDPRLDMIVKPGEPPYAARELLTLARHQRPVTTVAFSPNDGLTIMTASNDGDTVLWLSTNQKDQEPDAK